METWDWVVANDRLGWAGLLMISSAGSLLAPTGLSQNTDMQPPATTLHFLTIKHRTAAAF